MNRSKGDTGPHAGQQDAVQSSPFGPEPSRATLWVAVAGALVGAGAVSVAGPTVLAWLGAVGTAALLARAVGVRARGVAPEPPVPAAPPAAPIVTPAEEPVVERVGETDAPDRDVERIALALEALNAAAQDLAIVTSDANAAAEETLEKTRRSAAVSNEGRQAVTASTASIGQLGQRVGDIGRAAEALAQRIASIARVVGDVRELAQQSDLLALNTAIEATRAGVASAGTAVVAREMRVLANNSRGAADEVSRMLEGLKTEALAVASAARQGLAQAATSQELAMRAGAHIEQLSEVIRGAADAAGTIVDQSLAQAEGIERVVVLLSELKAVGPTPGNLAD